MGSLPNNTHGVRSRSLDNGNGLSVHVLEAGFEDAVRPLVLLLHGFPELAYSWRHILPVLAAAGFWVVAPDQRGYGWTTGWDASFDGDPKSFWMLNLVQDVLGLLEALQARSVATIVGHDFGSPVAAWCALTRPDKFESLVLMSAPFGGPPRPLAEPFASPMELMQQDLARLSPPRKHYHGYYSTREAAEEMQRAPQGLHAFLRAYYHVKSADWKGNRPHPLASWSARELATLPTYYVMNLHEGMAQTVAREAPGPAQIQACRWLTEDELRVYSRAFARTGFQGGLQWYRGANTTECIAQLAGYAGGRINVPCCFISGASDWGTYQVPGALRAMESTVCTDFHGVHLIDGAGHWVQQEQPQRVGELLLQFMHR
jgi:pimeloyl-ACP methyl ester carboxylesterase